MPHASPTIDAQAALECWLNACAANPWASLSDNAAQPYRYIWQSWVKHIEPKDWRDATGHDLLSFLNAIEQASKTAHKTSEVTRRRYWRVIDRVYEHANITGSCANNPAQLLEEADRPPQENPVGAVLTMRMWAALRAGLPDPIDPTSMRDRAALMALMELGITSQELCTLTMSDIDGSCLHVRGPREMQNRTLTMSDELRKGISQYLACRFMFGASALSDFVFVSREEPKWTTQTVQRISTMRMKYVARANKLPTPIKMGAQIIRNTVVLHWLLDGTDMHAALKRAGLKSPRALTHLRHQLPQHLRALVATSGISAD